jgi:hypothetical protein
LDSGVLWREEKKRRRGEGEGGSLKFLGINLASTYIVATLRAHIAQVNFFSRG